MVTIHQVEAALPPPGHDHEVGNARRSTRSPARPPIECTGLPPTVGLGHRCRTVLPSSQLAGFVPCATPRAEQADAKSSERERSAQAQWAGAVSCTRERARTNRCCSCVGLTPPLAREGEEGPGHRSTPYGDERAHEARPHPVWPFCRPSPSCRPSVEDHRPGTAPPPRSPRPAPRRARPRGTPSGRTW